MGKASKKNSSAKDKKEKRKAEIAQQKSRDQSVKLANQSTDLLSSVQAFTNYGIPSYTPVSLAGI